jgi:tetratricopeptide (TPR) repeat protein
MSVLLDALRKAAAEKQAAGSVFEETARPGQNRKTVTSERLVDGQDAVSSSFEDKVQQPDMPTEAMPEKRLQVAPAGTNESKVPDWSLSQIPGYQSEASLENAKRQQAQGVLQAMQQARQPNGHPLRWLGGSALAVFVLAGLGYYGWAYFQMQTQAVNHELAAYRTVPQETVLPVSPSSDAVESEEDKVQSHTPASFSESPNKAMPIARTERVNAPAVAGKSVTPAVTSVPTKHLKIVAMTEPTEAEKGYQAYQAGKLDEARQFYTSAYQQDAQNLPALFGLAAVSVKQGRKNEALRFYQRILEIDPQNLRAQDAALMLSSQVQGEASTENLVKRMRDFPENAALQAALGHQLAKENNWVAAQKQYFKAYQLAPNREDYALNLAVSLDKLGEYDLAKQYYERVLQASSARLSAERKEQVRQRVSALQTFLNREAKPS